MFYSSLTFCFTVHIAQILEFSVGNHNICVSIVSYAAYDFKFLFDLVFNFDNLEVFLKKK